MASAPTSRPTPPETADPAEAFAVELDTIHREAIARLGADDLHYMRSILRAQRCLEVVGRGILQVSRTRRTRTVGIGALALSKILDNLEIGHNVLHGQYDWAKDPVLHSHAYEWDIALPAAQWRHMHNFVHHTYTNVYGKDDSLRTGVLRTTRHQPWKPYHRANPLIALAAALLAEWAVLGQALDEIQTASTGDDLASTKEQARRDLVRKATRQAAKDFLLYPALTGPRFKQTLVANATALAIRNVWLFVVSLCSHFPEDAAVFTEEDIAEETPAQWYVRQARASANITTNRLVQILSGHHTHHIEHHLFPTLPSSRFAQIAPLVRAACHRHGIPYNNTTFPRQLTSALRNITRLSRQNAPARTGSEESGPR